MEQCWSSHGLILLIKDYVNYLNWGLEMSRGIKQGTFLILMKLAPIVDNYEVKEIKVHVR